MFQSSNQNATQEATRDNSLSVVGRQPLHNIIANVCAQVRRDLESIEESNMSLEKQYDDWFGKQCKLEREVEIYVDRLKQTSVENSRLQELASRLEHIITRFLPFLPGEEQKNLSDAVYAAKHLLGQQANANETKILSDDCLDDMKDQNASAAILDPPIDYQSISFNHQQQAIVGMFQLIQTMISQASAEQTNESIEKAPARTRAGRKKTVPKRNITANKKVTNENSFQSTQPNRPATSGHSQVTPSQASSSQSLRQTKMHEFFGKSE